MRLSIIALVASLSLAACSAAPSSSSSPPSPCPDAGATPADAGLVEADAAPAPDAGVDASPVDPCADTGGHVVITEIAPGVVGPDGGLVTLKGCNFLPVRDVEVNVYSVPFVVVDDRTIVFRAPPASELGLEEPPAFPVQVDVIAKQPNQSQAGLTYRW